MGKAIASHDRALALKADFANAHYNRAMALQALERYYEALAGYDRAIEFRPDFADAQWNKCLLLVCGDYENG